MSRHALLPIAAAVLMACSSAAGAASPRCLGAASRDPYKRCVNPRLRKLVTPTPDQADKEPYVYCATSAQQAVDECGYGPQNAKKTIAVLGDSHASHWRGAFKVLASRLRWRVIEFGMPNCAFSTSEPAAEAAQEPCRELNAGIVDWLDQNPKVDTIFVSASVRNPIVTGSDYDSTFDARVSGFLTQWDRLPRSVKHIVVLRDTPFDLAGTFDCVRVAIRASADAGQECAIKRSAALDPDAEVTAARMTDRSAKVLSVNSTMCDKRLCYPVVGGVLVHKDRGHIGQLFAKTLGPILVRKVQALL